MASEPPGRMGMPANGDLIAGKYRVEHMIGRGGMGAVFLARHELMDSPVALKWLVPELCNDQDARGRFLQEAKVAARIRHPNVVNVYDVGEQDGGMFMVMELLQGESFEALVERGDIPIPDMLQILVQAMDGVAAAHERGVVHRDIKPDNIFVVPDPTQGSGFRAKVLDFGISKLTEDHQRDTGITKSGVTMGTPAYMSIEQMNGAKDVDARADVYSFGVLMYRALTGQLPFKGDTFGAVAVALATHTPPQPKALRPDLPGALNDVVLRAMARERDDRFPNVGELLDELRSLSTADGYLGQMTNPSTSPPSITPRAQAHARSTQRLPAPSSGQTGAAGAIASVGQRRAGLWAALAVLLLGGGAVAFVVAGGGEQPAQPAQAHIVAPAADEAAPATDGAGEQGAAAEPAPVEAAEPAAVPPTAVVPPAAEPEQAAQAEDAEDDASARRAARRAAKHQAEAEEKKRAEAAARRAELAASREAAAREAAARKAAEDEARRAREVAAREASKRAAAAREAAAREAAAKAAAARKAAEAEGTSHRSGGVSEGEF